MCPEVCQGYPRNYRGVPFHSQIVLFKASFHAKCAQVSGRVLISARQRGHGETDGFAGRLAANGKFHWASQGALPTDAGMTTTVSQRNPTQFYVNGLTHTHAHTHTHTHTHTHQSCSGNAESDCTYLPPPSHSHGRVSFNKSF